MVIDCSTNVQYFTIHTHNQKQHVPRTKNITIGGFNIVFFVGKSACFSSCRLLPSIVLLLADIETSNKLSIQALSDLLGEFTIITNNKTHG